MNNTSYLKKIQNKNSFNQSASYSGYKPKNINEEADYGYQQSFLEHNHPFDDNHRTESSFDREKPLIKRKRILVLGAPGVGKSAVILRFKDDVFKPEYIPTLTETYKKEFIFNNEKVELEIKDLDGQNEFTLFSNAKFAYGINGYILCYSVENNYSFHMIQSINTRLSSLVGDTVPKIVIANKADLSNKRVISTEEGMNLARSINASFLECSARSGLNIQLVFHSVLIEINKMESNIDLKNFSCAWLIKTVLRNLSLNNLINYFLLMIQIVRISFTNISASMLFL